MVRWGSQRPHITIHVYRPNAGETPTCVRVSIGNHSPVANYGSEGKKQDVGLAWTIKHVLSETRKGAELT